jgi:uncharacterized protein YlxW (UPF0749 family)
MSDDEARVGPDDAAEPAAGSGPDGEGRESGAADTAQQPAARHRADGRPSPWHRGLSQVLIAVLCALLGIALVAQVRHNQEDPLASLRQDDLVRLLDDLDRRNLELADERERLQGELDELQSAADSGEVASAAAAELAVTQGVLAGTVPAGGPGVTITVADPSGSLRAQTLVTMIQELRNAGAEAISVNDVRLTATSYVTRSSAGYVVDGEEITSPFEFLAIGDPGTLRTALEIPGGALSSARGLGATVGVEESDRVEIWAVADPPTLEESRFVEV